MDPVLDFMRLLWNVEHGLQSTSKRMEATLGVTGPQRLVLRVVTERPGLSAGELARLVHLHPSTITGILQPLARKGLLRSERDRRDGRRIRLRSRVAAKGFLVASTGTVEPAVTRALAEIPIHRVRHAREVLSAIGKALTDKRGENAAASTRQTHTSSERSSSRRRRRCRRQAVETLMSMSKDLDSGVWDSAAHCVFERISEKWTLRVLSRLVMSPMHFLALQRSIDGVSKKVLAETLRRLERDGLVTRRPEPHHSSVEYSLTALGQGLCGPLEALRQWSEVNFAAVELARARFDAANSAKRQEQ